MVDGVPTIRFGQTGYIYNPMSEPTPEQAQPKLMEYLYLLPAILAVSPLVVAFRHTRGLVSQEVAVYVFRLLSLAWLWMVCAVMLYYWRPTVRIRSSFVSNVLRSTALGCVAVAPVALTSLALNNKYQVDVLLYSSIERGFAWLALIACAFTNAWFLQLSLRFRPAGSGVTPWQWLSGAVLAALALCMVWLL